MASTTTYGEVDSLDFAVYLNSKAEKMKLDVNVTKMQKWLYICYGLYLAAYKSQLLTERPKAWKFGPVFPRVHRKQVKNKYSLKGIPLPKNISAFEKYDEVIETVLDHFGGWTASDLVNWTHEPGRAWDATVKQEGEFAAIDNYYILKDFERLVD